MARKIKAQSAPTQQGPLTSELLGAFVRARRTQANLRLEEAALLCHVAKDTLSKIENAHQGVRFDSILKVCKMLGIELMVRPWSGK